MGILVLVVALAQLCLCLVYRYGGRWRQEWRHGGRWRQGCCPTRKKEDGCEECADEEKGKEADPVPEVVGDVVLEEIPTKEKQFGEKNKLPSTLPVVTTNPNSAEIASHPSIADGEGCRSSTPRTVLPIPSPSLVRGPDYIAMCPSSLDLTQEISSGWQGPSLKGGLVRVLEDPDLPVIHQSCSRNGFGRRCPIPIFRAKTSKTVSLA